jgi:hypothetical protein
MGALRALAAPSVLRRGFLHSSVLPAAAWGGGHEAIVATCFGDIDRGHLRLAALRCCATHATLFAVGIPVDDRTAFHDGD